MGFSSPESSGGGTDGKVGASHNPSFGDKLLSYLGNKYPLAGGLAQLAFGHPNQQPQAQPDPSQIPPVVPMAQQQAQLPEQPDLISMNAQPKDGGGGLSTILKLLAG